MGTPLRQTKVDLSGTPSYNDGETVHMNLQKREEKVEVLD